MSSDVQEIEQAIRSLPRPEVEQLRECIENFLEDQLEPTDEFKARIERGKAESIKSPAWHEDELRIREAQIPSGEAKFIDWKRAKADIRRATS
jgi:hypothetical protein